MGRFRFWKALPQVYPTTRRQPCWVPKTANVLDKLPKSMQGRAKSMLHDIYRTENQEAARKVYRLFGQSFQDKYPEAVKCLGKDEETLFRVFKFPAAHPQHQREARACSPRCGCVPTRARAAGRGWPR